MIYDGFSNLILDLAADIVSEVSCAPCSADGLPCKLGNSFLGIIKCYTLVPERLLEFVKHKNGDPPECLLVKIVEHNNLINSAEKFRSEELSESL